MTRWQIFHLFTTMFQLNTFLFIVLLFCVSVDCSYVSNNINHDKVGKYSFPRFAATGEETNNEFQLISPHKIGFSANFKMHQEQLLIENFGGSDHALDISRNSQAYKFTSISPTEISNNDIVYVSYYTNRPDTKGDWIGVYSPSNVDITKTVPGESF